MKLKKILFITGMFIAISCNNNSKSKNHISYTKNEKEKHTHKLIKNDKTLQITDSLKISKENNKNHDFIKSLISHKIVPNTVISDDILNKKDILKKSNLTLTLVNLEIKSDTDSICNDPICAIIILMKDGKPFHFIKIPAIYEDDVRFLFSDDNNHYVFENYSSPAGYSNFYIYDLTNMIVYKSDKIGEGTIDKNSFNYTKHTFTANTVNGNQVVHFKIMDSFNE